MRVTRSTLIILSSVVLMSIFLANVVNLLSTNVREHIKTRRRSEIKIDDSDQHLIWFLQISDIHLSIFQDPFRISEFKEFCDYTVNAIKPKVVLATGDLTDAKTEEGIGSRQFEEEWKHYANALRDSDVSKKTIWLDIRGNHDNFNVASPTSPQNFFTNYSIQGRKHPRSYMIDIAMPNDNEIYTFIGVDACLEPGPRRPFNFIGMLDQLEVDEINKLMETAKNLNTNYTIWFGHFPTSCVLSTGNEGIRDLIGKEPTGLVYLCGHLHQLGGLVTKMYTMQKEGFLELELSDWKDNRMYRLMAIDHGIFSFVDVHHRQWPIALITNPKHALFRNSFRENLDNIQNSTHIRVLAFSLSAIVQVKIRIDGGNWQICRQVNNGPLYVVNWDPSMYTSGLHQIQTLVVDSDGRQKTYSQPFQLEDRKRLSFDILPRIALMTDASTVFRAMFAVMLFISIVPLILLRIVHKFTVQGKISKPKPSRNCSSIWLRKFWILSTVDRICIPIVLYPLYLCFGPWSIGYLIEEHIGVIFAWGIFVNGAFLPGSFTYAYGFIQLLTFQVPLTVILAHGVDTRFQHKTNGNQKTSGFFSQIKLHLPFLLVFSIQVSMAYLFWLAYGTVAFILGPLRTWSLILAAVLWYQALYLPNSSLKKPNQVWSISPPSPRNDKEGPEKQQ